MKKTAGVLTQPGPKGDIRRRFLDGQRQACRQTEPMIEKRFPV